MLYSGGPATQNTCQNRPPTEIITTYPYFVVETQLDYELALPIIPHRPEFLLEALECIQSRVDLHVAERLRGFVVFCLLLLIAHASGVVTAAYLVDLVFFVN